MDKGTKMQAEVLQGLLQLVSDKVLDFTYRSNSQLAKFHCPLYSELEGKKELIGTSVLINFEGSPCLLTAAHVADIDDLFIPVGNTVEKLSGVWLMSPIVTQRKDDKDDWAIMALTQKYVDGLAEYSFLPSSEIFTAEPNHISFMYSYIGFPHTKNKTLGTVLKRRPYSNLNHLIKESGYASYSLDATKHLGLVYDLKRTIDESGKKIQAPDPHGMSGGGAWIWQISGRLLYGEVFVKPMLSGIIIEKSKDNKIWVATKVKHILEQLKNQNGVKKQI